MVSVILIFALELSEIGKLSVFDFLDSYSSTSRCLSACFRSIRNSYVVMPRAIKYMCRIMSCVRNRRATESRAMMTHTGTEYLRFAYYLQGEYIVMRAPATMNMSRWAKVTRMSRMNER